MSTITPVITTTNPITVDVTMYGITTTVSIPNAVNVIISDVSIPYAHPVTTALNDFQTGNGSGTWQKSTLAQTTALLGIDDIRSKLSYFSAGIIGADPSFVDNGDGTATIGTCQVLLYSTIDFTGEISLYNISGTILSFTDNSEEYIVIDYNAGTPIFTKTTNEDSINGSNQVEIFVVWRQATTLHSLSFDAAGQGLSNKSERAMLHTERYKVDESGGLAITESVTPNPRTIIISQGRVYTGAMRQTVSGFNSSVDKMTFVYNVGGVWTYTDNLVYNNTQYDNGTNLVTMNPNKWTVAWFYRSIGDVKQTFYVMGTNEYPNQAQAEASEMPRTDIPVLLQNHCLLVGRASIKKSSTSGIMTSVFGVMFMGSTVINHNDTANLQGGDSVLGNYYHLNLDSYNKILYVGLKESVSIKSGDYATSINDNVLIFTTTSIATLHPATGTGQKLHLKCRSGVLTIICSGSDTVKGEINQVLFAGDDLILHDTESGIWE